MATADALTTAREAYDSTRWRDAHAAYSVASRDGRLEAADVERFATAAHLFGRDAETRQIFAQGFRDALASEAVASAARFAFWIGHGLMFAGNQSQSAAWFARARALLVEHRLDCVEMGYLQMADGIRLLFSGQPEDAEITFLEVQAVARRFADKTLLAMGGHGRGRALIALGRIPEGMASLDEVMVAATTGEVSPLIVGDTYCGVLEACHDVFDVRRAREWTAALSQWCEAQPDLMPYRGPCLVHRVELLRLCGEWQDAFSEARRACEWLSLPASPEGPGDAYYAMAELHFLRADLDAAEEAFRQASRYGRRPEPGVALLWLARGQAESARAAVARCLEEAGTSDARRAELLAAHVEILLALGDVALARSCASELEEIAAAFDAPMLSAIADRAKARVLLAEGSAGAAVAALRRAWMTWQQLDAPFEAARERVQIGLAYRQLGDRDSAAMEFDAARWVFQQLGAVLDLRRLDAMAPSPGLTPTYGGLTPREAQVLGLLATGKTNKEIAADLVISEHTVARHVQNMLAKLGFPSRTRLAAFAVEQGITPPLRGQN